MAGRIGLIVQIVSSLRRRIGCVSARCCLGVPCGVSPFYQKTVQAGGWGLTACCAWLRLSAPVDTIPLVTCAFQHAVAKQCPWSFDANCHSEVYATQRVSPTAWLAGKIKKR